MSARLLDARIEEARRSGRRADAGAVISDFDTFCDDSSNQRAFAVAQMIAAGDGDTFPVWLVHSPPGCGKSHLLTAIAREAALRTPDRKVLIMTGQEFLEQFQSALHKKRDFVRVQGNGARAGSAA